MDPFAAINNYGGGTRAERIDEWLEALDATVRENRKGKTEAEINEERRRFIELVKASRNPNFLGESVTPFTPVTPVKKEGEQ